MGTRATRLSALIVVLLSGSAVVSGCRTKEQTGADKTACSDASMRPDCALEPAPGALAALLSYEDTDGDRRITVRDEGARWFALPLLDGTTRRIEGTARLAHLVQELFVAHEQGETKVRWKYISEPEIDRLSRLIRERFWDGLTRRIDAGSLARVLADPKMDAKRRRAATEGSWPDGCTPPPTVGLPQFLYVPHADQEALDYYQALTKTHPQLVVCRLPQAMTPEWVQSLDPSRTQGSRHGLLALGLRRGTQGLESRRYVVPGGRFNELYGWDSTFHVLGLLADGKRELAQSVVDGLLYEVRHYGKVLNANRTYYLMRAQPPLLSTAVRAVWESAPLKDRAWLRTALAAVRSEYERVWNAAPRATSVCKPARHVRQSSVRPPEQVCLAAYHAEGLGEPPEVEAGHFDWLYQERAARSGKAPSELRQQYLSRALEPEEQAELDEFFLHDRTMRESGHDTTYRFWTKEGDRAADYATIDLNALLFKVELDLAQLSQTLGDADWPRYCARAAARRDLVQEHLWNGELFVDAHIGRDAKGDLSGRIAQSPVVSATTLYPLWASAPSPCREDGAPLSLVANAEQAQRLVRMALEQLEAPGGLASTAPSPLLAEREPQRQWDYPFGWAPHQILAWEGLRRFGFEREAARLSYRWLYMVAKSAHDFHGTVPEKFDVVRRSHEVFVEYGNVGTDFSYITREGFGWMNASVQLGRQMLSEALLARLRALEPPETLAELR